MEFTDDMTLGEARALLRTLVDEGHICPCCTQLAKVYRRPLTAVGAAGLVVLYRETGRDYGHIPTITQATLPRFAHQGGYLTLSNYWGLIEEAREPREDGGRAGWWRVTEEGERFARGISSVLSHARIYNGRCLGLSGNRVNVLDCLGKKFHYSELMRGI